jgi:predicted RNA polymerase sigma factor
MIDIAGSESLRDKMSESLRLIVDNAVRAGWPEHEVALLLMELAETHLMKIAAVIITDDALHSQRIVSQKN